MDYDSCDDSQCLTDCIFKDTSIADGDSLTVYQESSPCDTCVAGTVYCDSGDAYGDTGYVVECTPISCGISGGDPHFVGFKGQKYDVMGQSHEIYNLITSSNLQINSRFVSYYKTPFQVKYCIFFIV